MLAAYYYNNKDIRVEEIPRPQIRSNEVLVKIYSSAICGSDLVWDYRKPKVEESIKNSGKGLVLGHELTGEIIECGLKMINKWAVGKRVVIAHHVPCGECNYCANGHETTCDLLRKTNIEPGGFSQLVRIPEQNVKKGLFILPDNISFDEGTFIEPLGCVIRGQRFLKLHPDSSLLIIGSGVSGLLHLKLARAQGLTEIYVCDINPYRLGKASEFGASSVINANDGDVSQQLKKLNGKGTVQNVIICSGSQQVMDSALGYLDRGGKMLYFACPPKILRINLSIDKWKDEITFLTTYGAAPKDMKEAISLIAGQKIIVRDMITHRFPLSDIQKGFNLAANPNDSLKIIIKPNEPI